MHVSRWLANIPADSAKQFPYVFRLGSRRARFHVFWRECATSVAYGIMRGAACRNRAGNGSGLEL